MPCFYSEALLLHHVMAYQIGHYFKSEDKIANLTVSFLVD